MTVWPGADRVRLCALPELLRLASELDGKRVTLMGLGLFGGGEGAARFLLERGARLTVTDLRPAERLASTLERLEGSAVTYRLGGHVEEDFVEADLVVANPAVPRRSPFLQAAQQAGVPITSPMNLFLALCPARVAAVSGTHGKSTTAALLAAMLERGHRRTWLGGNIGVSLLPSLSGIGPADLVVLELSSFQLEDAAALNWSPHVAVVTNLTPNHLDRHDGFGDYANAKRGILRFQRDGDFAVLNGRDSVLLGWANEGASAKLRFFSSAPPPGERARGVSLVGERLVWSNGRGAGLICSRDEVPLLGLHNVENIMAAAAAALCLGAGTEQIRGALGGFVGLEHRLELVGEFGGTRYYNDSYSTTPASGVAAVRSLPGPLTLIVGGSDKKLDLSPLARAAARSVDVLITLGQTGPFLAQRARQEGLYLGRSMIIQQVATLPEAVQAAVALSMPGSVVAFSPGCASYDMFENYEQRGRAFKDLVRTQLRAARPRKRRA